jgi:hypothetical protein|nr:MAG TPA: hypothetical protein [Caudoviricetes sp.]
MIEILKRIREWVGDHIDEMILSGFIITIFVLCVLYAIVASNGSNNTSSNTSSHCSTTFIPVYNGRITTLIPITRCY